VNVWGGQLPDMMCLSLLTVQARNVTYHLRNLVQCTNTTATTTCALRREVHAIVTVASAPVTALICSSSLALSSFSQAMWTIIGLCHLFSDVCKFLFPVGCVLQCIPVIIIISSNKSNRV